MRPSLGRTLRTRRATYDIYQKIASGGFASVFFGRCVEDNTPVAVKVLFPQWADNPRIVKLFEGEFDKLRNFRHPNLVHVLDRGHDDDGVPFIAMEWVTGWTLAELIERRGRFRVGEAATIICQVLDSLEAVRRHKTTVVHRDIKPDNIKVTPDGVVKVMDFGIAKDSTLGAVSGGSQILGTLRYMAPEQFTGDPLDCRTDLYAAGVTLYEMLTGRVPFDSDSTVAIMNKVLNENPPPLAPLRPDVPVAVAEAIVRALAKAPSDRFATPLEMRTTLRPFADRPVTVPSVPPAGPGAPTNDAQGRASPHDRRPQPDPPAVGRLRRDRAVPPKQAEPIPRQGAMPMWRRLGLLAAALLLGGLLYVVSDMLWERPPPPPPVPTTVAPPPASTLAHPGQPPPPVITAGPTAEPSAPVPAAAPASSPGASPAPAVAPSPGASTPAVIAVPPSPSPPVDTAAVERDVRRTIDDLNQAWADAVRRGGDSSALASFAADRWLHELTSQVAELRRRGWHRVATYNHKERKFEPVALVAPDRATVETAEEWDDITYRADGSKAVDASGRSRWRYELRVRDGAWKVVNATVVDRERASEEFPPPQNAPVPAQPPRPPSLELRIVAPHDGARVPEDFEVRGTQARPTSDQFHTWMVARPHDGDGRWYLVPGEIKAGEDNAWSVRLYLGGGPGTRHEVRVGVVDEATQRTMEQHIAARRGEPLAAGVLPEAWGDHAITLERE